jgi:hypothetical protein
MTTVRRLCITRQESVSSAGALCRGRSVCPPVAQQGSQQGGHLQAAAHDPGHVRHDLGALRLGPGLLLEAHVLQCHARQRCQRRHHLGVGHGEAVRRPVLAGQRPTCYPVHQERRRHHRAERQVLRRRLQVGQQRDRRVRRKVRGPDRLALGDTSADHAGPNRERRQGRHDRRVAAGRVGADQVLAARLDLEEDGRLGSGEALDGIQDDGDGRFQAIRREDRLPDFENKRGGERLLHGKFLALWAAPAAPAIGNGVPRPRICPTRAHWCPVRVLKRVDDQKGDAILGWRGQHDLFLTLLCGRAVREEGMTRMGSPVQAGCGCQKTRAGGVSSLDGADAVTERDTMQVRRHWC